MALGLLAELAADEGRLDEAIRVALLSEASAAEVGFLWWQLHQLYHACEWSVALEHPDEAEEFGTAALRIAHEIGDRQMIIYLLSLVARFAIEDEDTSERDCCVARSKRRKHAHQLANGRRSAKRTALPCSAAPGPDSSGVAPRAHPLTRRRGEAGTRRAARKAVDPLARTATPRSGYTDPIRLRSTRPRD